MSRQLQRIDCRIAAHEANHRTLHAGMKPEVVDDLKVQPRRIEPRAAGHQHVGDTGAFLLIEHKPVHGLPHQHRSVLLKQLHPPRRVGKVAWPIELMRVVRRELAQIFLRIEGRIAMRDAGAAHHAAEDRA